MAVVGRAPVIFDFGLTQNIESLRTLRILPEIDSPFVKSMVTVSPPMSSFSCEYVREFSVGIDVIQLEDVQPIKQNIDEKKSRVNNRTGCITITQHHPADVQACHPS